MHLYFSMASHLQCPAHSSYALRRKMLAGWIFGCNTRRDVSVTTPQHEWLNTLNFQFSFYHNLQSLASQNWPVSTHGYGFRPHWAGCFGGVCLYHFSTEVRVSSPWVPEKTQEMHLLRVLLTSFHISRRATLLTNTRNRCDPNLRMNWLMHCHSSYHPHRSV